MKILKLVRKLLNLNLLRNSDIRGNKTINSSCWDNVSLIHHPDGYWHVSPMPSLEQLNVFYASEYWEGRDCKRSIVNRRDLNHYLELKELYPNKTWSRILNIGAGHGGISVLFSIAGADVTNLEPSSLDYGIEWKTIKSLSEASGTFDLIYASHSLEHLTDIDKFFGHLSLISDSKTVLYFEVPNCNPANPTSFPNGSPLIPHTYYFKREYFEKLPYQVVTCNTYRSINKISFERLDDDSGEVIRYSGMVGSTER